jgi:hypothetical protein
LDNAFPASARFFSEFVNPAAGDFRLKPGSVYRGTASDGKDPSVDMDALQAALAGIR